MGRAAFVGAIAIAVLVALYVSFRGDGEHSPVAIYDSPPAPAGRIESDAEPAPVPRFVDGSPATPPTAPATAPTPAPADAAPAQPAARAPTAPADVALPYVDKPVADDQAVAEAAVPESVRRPGGAEAAPTDAPADSASRDLRRDRPAPEVMAEDEALQKLAEMQNIAPKPAAETADSVAGAEKSATDVTKPVDVARPDPNAATVEADKPAAAPAPQVALAKPAPAPAEAADPALAVPKFELVRVAPDGMVVMAGVAPPRAVVTVWLDGAELLQAPADRRGEWATVTLDPLQPGQRQLGLTAKTGDGTVLSGTAPVLVLIPEHGTRLARRAQPTAVQLPAAPGQASRVLQSADPARQPGDRLRVDTIDYDDDGNLVVSGAVPKDEAVRVYLNNEPVGAAPSGATDWQVRPSAPVPTGAHQLRVDSLGPDGKVVSRVEIPFIREAAAAALKVGPNAAIWVVQPGNSLWRIARRIYGRGILYTVIYEANDGQIRDPDLIYPGQIFTLPERVGS